MAGTLLWMVLAVGLTAYGALCIIAPERALNLRWGEPRVELPTPQRMRVLGVIMLACAAAAWAMTIWAFTALGSSASL